MKIGSAKNISIQFSGVFHALLMFVPVLLRKRLSLSHPILGTLLIFAVLGFFTGCGGSSGGEWWSWPRCFPLGCPEWINDDAPIVPDKTAPTVIEIYPRDQETLVPYNKSITVTFSESMRQSTINSETFFVTDSWGHPVIGSVRPVSIPDPLWGWVSSLDSFVFNPENDLDPLSVYTVIITEGATDSAGNHLRNVFRWSFASGPEGEGVWSPISTTYAPIVDNDATAIWTGSELIVYDGYYGAIYDPITDIWRPISMEDAPDLGSEYSAVWTGAEMIIWGSEYDSDGEYVNSGGRYDPVSDSWRPISTVDAPEPRAAHTAVWTGTEMIVWGGYNFEQDYEYDEFYNELNTGGRYDPVTDVWQTITTSGAPRARIRHTAIWTGTEVIIWGGENPDGDHLLSSGGAYSPSSNTWREISQDMAPEPRAEHTAIWTGTDMIVWGGYSCCEEIFLNESEIEFEQYELNTGGSYDPLTDIWQPINTSKFVLERSLHTAVWTGNEMIIWGGRKHGEFEGPTLYGGRYDPSTDSWTVTSVTGQPDLRDYHVAVWTGIDMIVLCDDMNADVTLRGGVYKP
jgi:hypothetical protein